MKKMMAALAAAAMLCCTLVSPVSAEETYRKGDVNMDGVVDCADSQIVLLAYTNAIAGNYPDFTEEQMQLASIVGNTTKVYLSNEIIPFSVVDAQVILLYYAGELVSLPHEEDEDIVIFYKKLQEYNKEHFEEHDAL